MGIITAAEYRTYSEVEVSEYSDEALEEIISWVSDEINRQFRTSFTAAVDAVEYYDGGEEMVVLRHIPVNSITSVEYKDSNGDWQELDSGDYEFYDYGVVELTEDADISEFPAGIKNVRVSYNYGFSTPPAYIKKLCALMVDNMISFDSSRSVRIRELGRSFNRSFILRI